MGCHKNINMKDFPKQGEYLDKRVEVCFYYDTSETIGGVIVRDDMDEPFKTIIKLDDGRFILAGECQYSIARETN